MLLLQDYDMTAILRQMVSNHTADNTAADDGDIIILRLSRLCGAFLPRVLFRLFLAAHFVILSVFSYLFLYFWQQKTRKTKAHGLCFTRLNLLCVVFSCFAKTRIAKSGISARGTHA